MKSEEEKEKNNKTNITYLAKNRLKVSNIDYYVVSIKQVFREESCSLSRLE